MLLLGAYFTLAALLQREGGYKGRFGQWVTPDAQILYRWCWGFLAVVIWAVVLFFAYRRRRPRR